MRKNTINITGKHSVCGVIGDPIEHTLSPIIHNALARATHEQMVYVPFHVTKDALKEAIMGAHALEIKGLNVTMPHKQQMADYVTQVDATAKKVGAINTLVYSKEGYKGYNTDAIGLSLSLKEAGIEWKDKNVAIIGSGGAAYAAYVAVAKQAKSIHLFNRTLANLEILKDHMETYFNTPTFIYEQQEKNKEPIDIVIQTTGIGMGNHKQEMPVCAPDLLRQAQVAIDLIYEPKETVFLKYAKEQGCTCINGFGMLFYQAVRAFELMHGISCDRECITTTKKEIIDFLEG